MLKGKTKIELTDVNTGEVEVIEKENMVTNALQYIFKPMGFVKAGSLWFTNEFVAYYKTLTGGLLLLNKPLEENPDNLYLPANVEQVGCAVYNKQNDSQKTLRGSFNATETEVDVANRKVKYVYDFTTAEGNGTIESIALTHAFGGYSNRGLNDAPVRGEYPFFKGIGSGLLYYTGTESHIGAYDRTSSYSTYGTGTQWIFKIDATIDSVYYFCITSNSSIKIRRYRANLHTISLFDLPGYTRTLLEETEITFTQTVSQQYFSYYYDDETDKLYIFSANSYYVSNNGSYLVTEIDMANDCAVTQYPMTNKCGASMRICQDSRGDIVCYRGYLYFANYGYGVTRYIYRQELGNSPNAQRIDVAIRDSNPILARNGFVYFEYPSSYSGTYCLYVVNAETFTFKYPESYALCDSVDRHFIPVKGYPLTYYASKGSNTGTFVICTDYLATINNLERPVTKTPDKTMKITYTLTEQ